MSRARQREIARETARLQRLGYNVMQASLCGEIMVLFADLGIVAFMPEDLKEMIDHGQKARDTGASS